MDGLPTDIRFSGNSIGCLVRFSKEPGTILVCSILDRDPESARSPRPSATARVYEQCTEAAREGRRGAIILQLSWLNPAHGFVYLDTQPQYKKPPIARWFIVSDLAFHPGFGRTFDTKTHASRHRSLMKEAHCGGV